MELGVPVGITEDQYQFILHYEIMWTGSDVDFAVPLVEITKELFSDFCAASFDRGFYSPANRARLDKLLIDNVLPKKGRLSKADREREQGETFVAMRRQHPAVESAINNLQRLPLTFELASLATTLGVRHGLVILDAQQYHSGGCLVGGTSVKGGIVFERVLICYGPVGNISASSGLFIFLDMAR